jgi:3-keto-5-aminohexanoate cleavage enzyme
MMTEEDAVNGASKMLANDIKPELEIYDPADIKYLNLFISRGIIKKPYWISALFNGNGTFPMPELMMTMMRALPPESLMSIIGIGAAQFPMLAMGIVLGMHVRVGLEDNVMYAPGELAKSNAQMVERVVRLAKELGRPIATPTQAREMMGLGAPREYNMPARS